MTYDEPAPPRPGCSTPKSAELRASFATVFAKIAGGALQRELDGEHRTHEERDESCP